MQKKGFFLDRDGIINHDTGYIYHPKDFVFQDGIFDFLTHIQRDYLLFIVTNQSGIGRGFYTEEQYQALTSFILDQLKEKGITITHVYHCPHTPEDACVCRKPNPTSILKAAATYDLDLSQSWMIGDRESDIEAGLNAGILNTIFISHSNKMPETKARYTFESIGELLYLL